MKSSEGAKYQRLGLFCGNFRTALRTVEKFVPNR